MAGVAGVAVWLWMPGRSLFCRATLMYLPEATVPAGVAVVGVGDMRSAAAVCGCDRAAEANGTLGAESGSVSASMLTLRAGAERWPGEGAVPPFLPHLLQAAPAEPVNVNVNVNNLLAISI